MSMKMNSVNKTLQLIETIKVAFLKLMPELFLIFLQETSVFLFLKKKTKFFVSERSYEYAVCFSKKFVF